LKKLLSKRVILLHKIVDNNEKCQVSLDVPGIEASDIQVNIDEDGKVLAITGSRKISQEQEKISETSTFLQSFHLDPSVIVEKITVLIILAPKDSKKIQDSVRSISVTEIFTEDNSARDTES